MNSELKLHIRNLYSRALFSLFAILITVISIFFGILFLFVPSYIAIIFFVISGVSITYLIYTNRTIKKEIKENIYKPVSFNTNRNFSFEEIVVIFENMTRKENQLSISENVLFFRSSKIFNLRTILYKTTDFNKKDFDNAKDRINKKANKKLKISQWVSSMDAVNMMRFNIIYTKTLNNALYKFISQNANSNLRRVESIINIAIVDNQIMIPPLYGKCDLAEVTRYKDVIKFINQILLNNK